MVKYQLIQDTIQEYFQKYGLGTTGLDYPAAKKLAIQLGVSTTIIYAFFRLVVYRLYLSPINRLPGPKVGWFPLMGNSLDIFREEPGAPLKRWAEKYGGIYKFHGPFNTPIVVVSDHVLLKQVLTTDEYDFIKPPEISAFMSQIIGKGLIVAEGDIHRHQRKMLSPAFSVSSIRAMVPLIAKPGYQLRDKWIKMIAEDKSKVKTKDGQEFTEAEVSTDLSMATLDVIGWALGQDFKSLEFAGTENQTKLGQAYLYIFSSDILFSHMFRQLFPFIFYLPTKSNKNNKKYMGWLHEECRALVRAGIARAAKAKSDGIKDDKPKDLLDTIIDLVDEETGEGFTVEELKEQCLTFLAAGHESASVSLSWCLWLLAKDQKVQDELRAEVRTLFKEGDEIPSYEDINSLPLLNNVVRETLRLIPIAPYTIRSTRVPVVLGSYAIPKGTLLFLPPIVTHHSKAIWGNDAEKFNPYRWEGEKVGNAYQYMPFLAGARACIGYRFATVEFKLLLATLVRNIQYLEKPGLKITMKQQLTLKPSPDMTLWMRVV